MSSISEMAYGGLPSAGVTVEVDSRPHRSLPSACR